MRLILPGYDPEPVDDAALASLYAADDRSRGSLRVNFVSSLDGAVTLEGYSEGLSGPADKRVFELLRMIGDAVMVAAGTLRHEGYGPIGLDDRRRAWRRTMGLPECPPLVVVSRSLALDPAMPALADAPVRPYVVTCAAAPADARAALAEVAEVLVHGETDVDLTGTVADLHGRGVAQILCEGGPYLLGSLTAADLVDELCLTLGAVLTGPGAGRITAGPPTPAPRRLTLRHVLEEDGMLLLRYAR